MLYETEFAKMRQKTEYREFHAYKREAHKRFKKALGSISGCRDKAEIAKVLQDLTEDMMHA